MSTIESIDTNAALPLRTTTTRKINISEIFLRASSIEFHAFYQSVRCVSERAIFDVDFDDRFAIGNLFLLLVTRHRAGSDDLKTTDRIFY